MSTSTSLPLAEAKTSDAVRCLGLSLLIPGVTALLAFCILMGLGFWQLNRKAWKEDIIAHIEARAYGEPTPVPPLSSWPSWTAQADEYQKVTARGTYRHDQETRIHGLMPGDTKGMPVQGFYLLTPLALEDGGMVIINRGFVRANGSSIDNRLVTRPEGPVTVMGLLRAPEKAGWFVPANDPARGEWFTRDLAAIAQAQKLEKVAPFLIDADAASSPGPWPKGGLTRLDLPNDHLQYAFTWFGLAVTLLGVFAAWSFRRVKMVTG